jgi:GH15 family glucan-1,4-alpha-glucosidase
MPLRLEDYALIGDMHSAALVGTNGSIDWLCWPRFDSDACFAALLGDATQHGHWLIAPRIEHGVRRGYLHDSLVLQTEFENAEGCVRVVDFMSPRQGHPTLVRVIDGVRGRMPMRMRLAPAFGYGARTPYGRQHEDGSASLIAGPDAIRLQCDMPLRFAKDQLVSEFEIDAGDHASFVLQWYPSFEAPPPREPSARALLGSTEAFWRGWCGRCTYEGPLRDVLVRSLVTLKALTYAPTGGIVAAPTTSLPEQLGGVRNWDYRYCWIRDATFTLLALMHGGYLREAGAWRDWLLRAIAGHPREMQIAYGLAGERRMTEIELPWLPGYHGARPVRIGNAAVHQRQLDVFGEVMDCLHQARTSGIDPAPDVWPMQCELIEFLEGAWRDVDAGIWEVRGPRRHFTHSKVMAWVAVDRSVRDAEALGFEAPIDRWKQLRAQIHAEVCELGFDPNQNCFVQAYGNAQLDASLLLIPQVGFLPISDPRVRGTIDAVHRRLTRDGLVFRYDTRETDDGLPSGEGVFLACTLWLADDLCLLGRHDEARVYFDRILNLSNDVGLLSEEYDPRSKRLVGNFPQAFSHVALANTALNLSRPEGPAKRRGNSH